MNLQEELLDIVKMVRGSIPEQYEKVWDQPLTGKIWDLDAVDLVYIIMEIMERYGVRFEAEEFAEYKLNSLSGIRFALEKRGK